MRITLWPDLVDWPIKASVSGDVIKINGENVDLSGIPEGYRLPGAAVGNKWFVESDYVERVDGELRVTIRLPVQWDSPEELRNPATPLVLSVFNGQVSFPDTSPPAIEIEQTPLESQLND
jgi:hypothetical protein